MKNYWSELLHGEEKKVMSSLLSTGSDIYSADTVWIDSSKWIQQQLFLFVLILAQI